MSKLAYTVKEAADVTGIPLSRMRIAIAEGSVKTTPVSPKRYVIRHEHLVEFLDSLGLRESA